MISVKKHKVKMLISSLFLHIRIKPCDFDYLKIIGKGSFGKVRSLSYFPLGISSYLLGLCAPSPPQAVPLILSGFLM